MKKRIIKISILVIILILLLLFILRIINTNNIYKEAIDNIEDNYDMIFDLELPDEFDKDDKLIMGNLKTEHTSNLVHSINQVYEENYDFILEKKDNYLYLYLNDKVSKIEIDKYYNIFKIDKLTKCKKLNKENKKITIDNKNINVNKYNYSCGEYNLSIYTSKILNKYIKSEILYDDISIKFYKDNVIYNNGLLNLNYTNIKDDNYVLNAKIEENLFKMFYTYNDYSKYSFIYNDNRFNIVVNNDIILSFNCDTRRYSNLKITLTNKEIDVKNDYQEIDISEMLSLILSSEIYSLFNE